MTRRFSIRSRWSRVDAHERPNHRPARHEDRCIRSATSGSSPGSVRSAWARITSPVATSTGSPAVGMSPGGRAAAGSLATPSRPVTAASSLDPSAARSAMLVPASAAVPVPSVATASATFGTRRPSACAGSLPHPVPTRPLTRSCGLITSLARPAAVPDSPAAYSAGCSRFHWFIGSMDRPNLMMSAAPSMTPPVKEMSANCPACSVSDTSSPSWDHHDGSAGARSVAGLIAAVADAAAASRADRAVLRICWAWARIGSPGSVNGPGSVGAGPGFCPAASCVL